LRASEETKTVSAHQKQLQRRLNQGNASGFNKGKAKALCLDSEG